VDEARKKKTVEPEATPEAERRRIGKVVHDDRGNASVMWHDAPSDYERPVLEVLGDPGLSIKSDDESFDPYARHRARKRSGNTTRTDLRKLSEWIKLTRELEERKRNGGEGDTGKGSDDQDEA
jgi:hypothetical protein